MCYPVPCSQCGKTTWGGCGAHVASVMSGVPQDKRCVCHEAKQPAPKKEKAR